jgi:hypothetical protein
MQRDKIMELTEDDITTILTRIDLLRKDSAMLSHRIDQDMMRRKSVQEEKKRLKGLLAQNAELSAKAGN